MIRASVQDLTAVQHSINVHKSPQEASVYVARGSLTRGPGAQQAGGQAPGALPRSGDAENWGIGGPTAGGLLLLGAGLVARRRGVV